MSALDIVALIDAAPAFVDEPDPAPAEKPKAPRKRTAPTKAAGPIAGTVDQATLRQYGLGRLNEEISRIKGATGDVRRSAVIEACEALGAIAGAGALDERFAKASIENAAAAVGLVRDDGIKPVRSLIAKAFRRGSSRPQDLEEIRRAAADRAASREPKASDHISASRPTSADRIHPSGDASIESEPAADTSFSSSSAAAPAPPAGANEDASSQTGAKPSVSAAGGTGGDRKPPRAAESEDARNMRLAFFPLTDLGNAERFRERYRGRLLWCQALGWLAWDGKRWSREGADSTVKIAEHDTVRAIQREAAAVRESGSKDDPDAPRGARDYVFDAKKGVMYSDKIASWGRSSEAVNKLGALSKRGEPYFAVGIEKLDADKMKINVNNGTLVVTRKPAGDADCVSFQPHDPADLITKLAPVDYLPEAPCPEYDRFIARVQPDLAMRLFLHQWGGLSLTGDVSEQILAFLYGKGGNGKSVLVDIWGHVAGDYGETVPIETFLDQGKSRSGGQATPDLAILPGVRMLRTSEPEKNSKLAEAMVKLVTGGEPIQARHLNRDFFKFYPQFKLTMSGNYRPMIAGTDEGIWRRVRLVPFDVTIPKEERDIHLPDKLRSEASGILNRLLDGLRSWCDRGLSEPEHVTKATAEYRSDSDPLGRFLATCVVSEAGGRVQSSVLHEVFKAWCKSSGEKEWSNRGLSMAMRERGFASKQSNTMWFLDIKLIRGVADFVDAHGNPIRESEKGTNDAHLDAADMEI